MQKQLSPAKRRETILSASAAILATFPILVLLPMRQAHWLSDPPYFMMAGFCIGVAIVFLASAITAKLRRKAVNTTGL